MAKETAKSALPIPRSVSCRIAVYHFRSNSVCFRRNSLINQQHNSTEFNFFVLLILTRFWSPLIPTVVPISPLRTTNSQKSSSLHTYVLPLQSGFARIESLGKKWETPPQCSLNMILKKFNGTAITYVSDFDFCFLLVLWMFFTSNFLSSDSFWTCNSVTQQEIVSLYQRFCQLDRNSKGYILADEFLSVPEFAMNPLSQVIWTISMINFLK